MSDLQIHINRAGQQYGPYPEATAREMLAAGQLLPTDLAWHPGAEGWKTLQELLGAEAAQASPAPPPPSNPAGPPKRQVAGGQPAEEKKEEPKEGEEADDPDKIHVTRKGEPIGPYPRDKAREYFMEGTLLPTDWGWHDGMGEDWKPLNEVLELPLPAGAGGGGSVSGGPWTIGGCLSEGWQKFRANLGPVILFFIISSLVLFITAVLPLVNFFVFVPVMAGYLFYFIKFSRGEPVAIGDLFSGFKRGYAQLLLVALLIGVIGFVAALPGISVMIFSGAAFITDLMGTIQDGTAGNITDFGAELERIFISLKAAGVGLLAGVILMILLPPVALSFTSFSMPLVIDRQMKAVDAIIASARLMKGQWFKVVFFLMLTGLISGFGQIVVIGVLVTGPLAMTAWAIFYLKNAGSITAAYTAPLAKNMKIGLICGAVLPVGAAVAAVVMAGGSIVGVAGAIDSNGTSEDAGNSGGAQTVDMAKEVPGVYLIGAPQGGPNGLPIPMVITFKEDGDATINLEALKGGPGTGFKWEVDPDEDNTIKYLDAAGQEKKSRLIPGKGLTGDDGLSLREETLTGSYSFNSGTTQGRLVLKKNHKAELRTGGPNPINLGWYVIGGFKQSPHEIWVTGGSIQLILSLDMDAKPYSMKLVARLQPNQASGKIDRLPIPEDRQITYTRAKGGGGQGGGQGGGNKSPEPEE